MLRTHIKVAAAWRRARCVFFVCCLWFFKKIRAKSKLCAILARFTTSPKRCDTADEHREYARLAGNATAAKLWHGNVERVSKLDGGQRLRAAAQQSRPPVCRRRRHRLDERRRLACAAAAYVQRGRSNAQISCARAAHLPSARRSRSSRLCADQRKRLRVARAR